MIGVAFFLEHVRAVNPAAAPTSIKYRLAATPVLLLALLLVLVAARDTIFSLLERVFGLQFADLPIVEVSTLPGRVVTAGLFVLALVLLLTATRRLPLRWRYLTLVVAVFAGTLLTFKLMGGSKRPFIVVAGLFAANAAPQRLLLNLYARTGTSELFDALFGYGVLVSEVLLPVPFLIWLRAKSQKEPRPIRRVGLVKFVPALAIAGVLMGLTSPFAAMGRLSWMLTHSPEADRFYGDGFGLYTSGSVATVAIDPVTSRLFLCGDGLATVLAVSLKNVHAPPLDTRIETGGAQFCYVDVARRELLVVYEETGMLKVADLDTFAIKKSIGPLGAEDGETFVAKQLASPWVVAGSEDVKRDASKPRLRVIDLDSGRTLAGSNLRPGYLFVHPTRPIAYASSYSGDYGIVAVNLPDLSIRARQAGDARLDRITLDARRDQILVASPLHGRVLVYDASTLKPLGAIPTQFGVRSVAVDPTRDWMITASLVTRRVDVIDLKSHNLLATYTLGPWLRDIAVDARCGRAFVSSRTGVYALQYAKLPHPVEGCESENDGR